MTGKISLLTARTLIQTWWMQETQNETEAQRLTEESLAAGYCELGASATIKLVEGDWTITEPQEEPSP